MNQEMTRPTVERRSFLSRIAAGAAALAGLSAGASRAEAQAPSPAVLPPPNLAPRHAEDDWFDRPAAKHRFFMDTTTVASLAGAVFYSNNFYNASRDAYRLTDADSALIIGVRHQSTPFAFTDAMWAKYGKALADHAAFTDPKTNQTPVINVLQSAEYRMLANRGVVLKTVLDRGLRLSVCSLATRAIAGAAARQTGGSVDDIFKELTSNLVPNANMVPAGIIALSRAQERGYTYTVIV